MYKIAAVGDKDSIYGFASLGINIFPVNNSQDGVKTIRHLADAEYGVIYITEALASEMSEELAVWASKPLPAIIPIPGVRGNTGIGQENVSRFVEKAVGSDIIS